MPACLLAFVIHVSMCFMPLYLKLYAGLPPISGGIPFSSSLQDPSFAANKVPPTVTEERKDLYVGSAIGPPSTAVNPVKDPDILSKAGSVNMGQLDLDLSLPAQPSSLGEGSSLTPALGMFSSSLLLGNLFHNRVILIHVSLQYPYGCPLVLLP